jgi:hypothetical protein
MLNNDLLLLDLDYFRIYYKVIYLFSLKSNDFNNFGLESKLILALVLQTENEFT